MWVEGVSVQVLGKLGVGGWGGWEVLASSEATNILSIFENKGLEFLSLVTTEASQLGSFSFWGCWEESRHFQP